MNITTEKAHLDAFLSNDGTSGHSKGNWQAQNCFSSSIPFIDTEETPGLKICTALVGGDEEDSANMKLIAFAQHAPHDCGDPECPGVINKRKLELYDKFQVAINEFAKAGLLT